MKDLLNVLNSMSLNSKASMGDKNALDSQIIQMGEISIPICELYSKYPPQYTDPYKASVWQRVADRFGEKMRNGSMEDIQVGRFCLGDCENFSLDLNYSSQWSQKKYFFDNLTSDNQTYRWYLNFADPTLFVACLGSLFAQDEIQTLEHPLLCSVRAYLISNRIKGLEARCHDGKKPTPFIISNVPYLVEVNTTPKQRDGKVVSIYGNAFRYYECIDSKLLDSAITVLDSHSVTNIIAMSAPCPSYGFYDKRTIMDMLSTVIAAFEGAKYMSPAHKQIEIHTGRWGAGAFGGNEELSILIQMIGAKIAKVDQLVFHAVTDNLFTNAATEIDIIERSIKDSPKSKLIDIVDYLFNKGYQWGVSDGN